jgi:hypothetical protein
MMVAIERHGIFIWREHISEYIIKDVTRSSPRLSHCPQVFLMADNNITRDQLS